MVLVHAHPLSNVRKVECKKSFYKQANTYYQSRDFFSGKSKLLNNSSKEKPGWMLIRRTPPVSPLYMIEDIYYNMFNSILQDQR